MSMPISTMPTLTGTHIVSHLESIAASLERQISPTQSTNSQQGPVSTQSPTSFPVTATSKKDKRKRSKSNNQSKSKKSNSGNNDRPSEINVADIQAMNKSSIDLRVLAEKYAQTGLSQQVLHSVLKFHEEMQTLIAIKALELGITVSTIEEIFGKYLGVRQASAWNGFLQSEFAKEVFKAAGGIGSGEAMKILSDKWGELHLHERATYKKKKSQDEDINANTLDIDPLDEELDEMGVGSQARSGILQSRTNPLTKPRCLERYKIAAERFMDNTLANCIPVAHANHFEMVLIAVSTHIGKHNFQITRNTVGLNKAINVIYEADGVNKLPVQLQSYLVGKEPNGLVTELADRSRRIQSKVVGSLSQLLYDTVGLKHWPWSNCDAVLANAGVELKLLPGARSVEETFKTPSNKLTAAKVAALDADLKEHLIQLVRLPRTTGTQPNLTLDACANTVNNTPINHNINTLNQTQPLCTTAHNQTATDFNRVNTNIIERGRYDPLLFGMI
ncbi:hypothetical protein DFH28DRAFT_1037062 [Melampsora americana]|nr:hypothetical protein DFH28DRAFT_1037062 [Melampsora americana]